MGRRAGEGGDMTSKEPRLRFSDPSSKTRPKASILIDILLHLPNGKILMVGGLGRSVLYDFQSDTFSAAPAMHAKYEQLNAFPLHNGKILFIGWSEFNPFIRPTSPSTELYDPATNTFVPGPVDRSENAFHWWPAKFIVDTATMLADGKILITHPDGVSVIYTP